MMVQLAIAVPLLALSTALAHVTRRSPARRRRQEAAWRDLIRGAGLIEG